MPGSHAWGVTLTAFGLFTVAGVGLLTLRHSAPEPEPGKIVPRQSKLTWQGPEKPKSTQIGALSMDDAFARFEIENVGGLPVHILAVQSSCGCAEPKVEPTTLGPGGIGSVEVRALPIQVGEKLATITLRTDSPLTPEVVLQLRVIGGRRPPFLLEAAGELTWSGGFPKRDTRTIVATQVEWEGSKSQPPIVKCSLPYLNVHAPRLQEEPYGRPGVVQRQYHFEVEFTSDPPRGVFSGVLEVIDPWDSQHTKSIVVHGETPPPLKVVPSRAVLDIGKGAHVSEVNASFLIQCADPAPLLTVEAADRPESPLIVSPIRWIEKGRRALVSVGVDPGRAREGVFEITVRRAPPSTESVVVPVLLRAEGAR